MNNDEAVSVSQVQQPEIAVAYIVSRFPSVTETFVFNEMLELKKLGYAPRVYTLLRTRVSVEHAGIEKFMRDLVHVKILSFRCIAAQFYWLRRRPGALMRLWVSAVRGNYRSLKFLSRTLVTLPLAAEFARVAEASSVQHVHAHFATHSALAALAINRLTGIPYSVTVHAHDLYVDRSMLDVKLREASFVVTISQFNAELLRDLYGDALAKNVSVVRCGVDGDLFKPALDKTGTEIPKIVCVGSLSDYKGQRFLIDACAGLLRQGLRFECALIGDGDQRVVLQNKINKAGLDHCVKLLGAMSGTQVVSALQKADIFVLPSVVTASGKMEGIPVALMEAMAMELPVVTTRLSGIPELVIHDHTGLLVEPGDSSGLCDALSLLITNGDKRRALGKSARNFVLAEFNVSTGARLLAELIQTVFSR